MSAASDELADEVEALNSIYGDGTLAPSPSSSSPDHPNVHILILPYDGDADTDDADGTTEASERASLLLSFPPSYPASDPPFVLATHSAGASAKPGAAAHALSLFREAVLATFVPGTVCLFDAIEDFDERRRASRPDPQPPTSPRPQSSASQGAQSDDYEHGYEHGYGCVDGNARGKKPSFAFPSPASPPPSWTLSDPYTEMKSTFLARCAPVTSPDQAAGYVSHLLETDKKARAATHNMTAWRIRGPNGTSYQDCDDDGEAAAGGRLLRLLQLMDAWDVMVVVTRWYGGQKLGPRRFAVINTVAREAVVRLVGGDKQGQASKKKGK